MEQLTKSYQNLMLYTIFEYGDFKKKHRGSSQIEDKDKEFQRNSLS